MPKLPDLLPAAEVLAKGVRHVLCYVSDALTEKRRGHAVYEAGDCLDETEHLDPDFEPECSCFWTDEKYWTKYFGAVEPGSQREWNPDCPVHPPLTAEQYHEACAVAAPAYTQDAAVPPNPWPNWGAVEKIHEPTPTSPSLTRQSTPRSSLSDEGPSAGSDIPPVANPEGQPTYEITLHRTELIPGGNGARIGFSDDFPGQQFLIIPQ